MEFFNYGCPRVHQLARRHENKPINSLFFRKVPESKNWCKIWWISSICCTRETYRVFSCCWPWTVVGSRRIYGGSTIQLQAQCLTPFKPFSVFFFYFPTLNSDFFWIHMKLRQEESSKRKVPPSPEKVRPVKPSVPKKKNTQRYASSFLSTLRSDSPDKVQLIENICMLMNSQLLSIM